MNIFFNLRTQASNIKRPNNTTYTTEEFLATYPQFGGGIIPEAVLGSYLEMANAVVSEVRFGAMWKYAIELFAAHMISVWLMGFQEEGTPAAEVVAQCSNIGVITSESADGVSYSLDTSALQDLAGWADFKLTRYGIQYAALAKRLARGGMYIW